MSQASEHSRCDVITKSIGSPNMGKPPGEGGNGVPYVFE